YILLCCDFNPGHERALDHRGSYLGANSATGGRSLRTYKWAVLTTWPEKKLLLKFCPAANLWPPLASRRSFGSKRFEGCTELHQGGPFRLSGRLAEGPASG